MKTAEEILDDKHSFSSAPSLSPLQKHFTLEAMEQYRTEGLRDVLWNFEIYDKGLAWCMEHASMIHEDISEYLKQKGLPL